MQGNLYIAPTDEQLSAINRKIYGRDDVTDADVEERVFKLVTSWHQTAHEASAARLATYEAALREIAKGEVTVWDEGLQENIIGWMDEEEMQDIARKALEDK